MRLGRVRRRAQENKDEQFTALLHHLTLLRLSQAFYKVKRDAAPGIDGVIWKAYEQDINNNLQDLLGRLHRGSYKPLPSKRTYIPKPDGRQRPLGIAALEDKIAQRAITDILNAVYEEDFMGFSYGFRPRKKVHDALDALYVGLERVAVNWVLDADIRGFFDALDHEWLMTFIEHRIRDKRILKLIRRWLKAGVMEEGKLRTTDKGTPQGASLSPLLANIYLHYTLDLWMHQWRLRKAKGKMIFVRWADDFVVGFQKEQDARNFLTDLQSRMQKFHLELHRDKTRVIRFGRRAWAMRKRGTDKPGTFDFLGFTHMCSQSRRGQFKIVRKTMAKKMRVKIAQVKAVMRKKMHNRITEQGRWLKGVLLGYYRFYAVPDNFGKVQAFRREVARIWFRTLRRRSQRRRITWEKMKKYINKWLPPVRILHPYPNVRFFANTRGRSPVR